MAAIALPLAVYGTLRPGGRAYEAFNLASRTRHLGACRLRGRLVDLGGYPGLIDGGESVAADLLAVDDAALWAELDIYEGPGYDRRIVALIAPAVQAMAWVWTGAVDGASPVPGNDWSCRTSEEVDPADDR